MNDDNSIKNKIYEVRSQRVMLDSDLAALYGVETRALNQAVKRNIKRFEGDDFMFQLTKEEFALLNSGFLIPIELYSQIKSLNITENQQITDLISQIVISNPGKTNTRKQPYTFTELGVAMLNESTRMQLDSISAALANLQSQSPRQKSQQKVGFLKEDTGR